MQMDRGLETDEVTDVARDLRFPQRELTELLLFVKQIYAEQQETKRLVQQLFEQLPKQYDDDIPCNGASAEHAATNASNPLKTRSYGMPLDSHAVPILEPSNNATSLGHETALRSQPALEEAASIAQLDPGKGMPPQPDVEMQPTALAHPHEHKHGHHLACLDIGGYTYHEQQYPSKYGMLALDTERVSHSWHAAPSATFGLEPGVVLPETDTADTSFLRSLLRFLKGLLWDVVTQDQPARVAWLVLQYVLLIYAVITTPYFIAFNIDLSDLTTGVAALDLAVSVCFMVDIFVNLRTAYMRSDGHWECNRWRIARRYLQYWFWIDAITSIPWQLVVAMDMGWLRLLRVLRAVRLFKVLSVIRLLRMLRSLEVRTVLDRIDYHLGRLGSRILFFVSLVLNGIAAAQTAIDTGSTLGSALAACLQVFTLVHWAACAFYYMAALNGNIQDTWLYDQDLTDSPYVDRYITAVYWAFTTVTTVGYGDVTAVSIQERVVAICVEVVGASVFAYLIGALANLLSDLNYAQTRINRKLTAVDAFLEHRRVPRVLATKIRNYFDFVTNQEMLSDEVEILSGLSQSLRSQLLLHMYRSVLEKVSFFQGKDTRFIAAITQYLKPEYYGPGDFVMYQGDISSCIYFVLQGKLEARLYEVLQDVALAFPPHVKSRKVLQTMSQQFAKRSFHRIEMFASKMRHSPSKLPPLKPPKDAIKDCKYEVLGVISAGQHFGETTSLLGKPRSMTVVALNYTELYRLSRADLDHCMEDFPELQADLERFREELQARVMMGEEGDEDGSSGVLGELRRSNNLRRATFWPTHSFTAVRKTSLQGKPSATFGEL